MWNSWDKGNIFFGLHSIFYHIFRVGKVREQGSFGQRTTIGMEAQGRKKRTAACLMIILLLWSFLALGYQRLFWLLTEFRYYLFSFQGNCLFHVCLCACVCGSMHVDIRMPVTIINPYRCPGDSSACNQGRWGYSNQYMITGD